MTDSVALIGKYEIVEEIGRGGFATVYKAIDTTLDRQVALKVLDPLFTRDHAFIARFQQEARITARLFHPNIAAIFEVGQVEGRHFLAIQYIPGRNLRDRVQERGPLSLDEIAALLQQVGAALDYAHSRGAIHRDVKPSNIILDENDHATLTDFGIVKALEATTVQTTGGGILGTPSYASPEQAESKPLDGRSDLYSLGIVAYELCTGQVPFVADTTPSLFYKIVHEAPATPSQVNRRVTNVIEQVLLKAIAKQPDQRYSTCQEFSQALVAAIEQTQNELLESLYEQARPFLAAGNFDAAEDNLRQVLMIQPGHRDAQALLNQVNQKRESTKRYTDLEQLVNQARTRATELRQADPDLADPSGVLRLLIQDERSPQTPPSTLLPHPRRKEAQPASAPTAQKASRLQAVVALVLLVGAIAALNIGLLMTKDVWIPTSSEDGVPLVYRLVNGNLLIGIGLSAALSSLLMAVLSVRKPR